MQPTVADETPNVLVFLVDNLGFGELGCYGGGILRGADTRRLDQFAGEGMKLLNFAPEAQCTPSRSALMTGRYAIRSGNRTVPFVGSEAGLVAWERTMGDLLSANGYATACVGNTYVASIIAGDAPFCAISTPLNAERCALGARPSRVALGRLCTTGPASGRRLY